MTNSCLMLILLALSCQLFGCKSQTKIDRPNLVPKAKKDWIGMKIGGNIELDKSLRIGRFLSEKKETGLEYGMAFVKACENDAAFDDCHLISEYVLLFKLISKDSTGEISIVVDAKESPNDPFGSDFCQTQENFSALVWSDYSNKAAPIKKAAWKVDDNVVKWVEIPVDMVNCNVEEENH
jgi:hypothetical protein